MQVISSISAIIVIMACLVTPVFFLIFLVRWAMKKPKKKCGIITLAGLGCVVIFSIIGTFTDPATYCEHEWELVEKTEATCTSDGIEINHCNLCGRDSKEKLTGLGHVMIDVRRVEPTYTEDGEHTRACDRCGYTEVIFLERLQMETEATLPTETTVPPTTVPATEPPITEPAVTIPFITLPDVTESIVVEPPVTFEDIYKAYKSNELVADDMYKGNRYQITATINGIETGGLFNLTGGATLTMEMRVDRKIVFFYAEFEKDQEDALKQVVVGDTITFEGECRGVGMWVECEIVR